MKPNNPSRPKAGRPAAKKQSRAKAKPVPHPLGGRLVYRDLLGKWPEVELLLSPQQFWGIEELIASDNCVSDLIPNTPAPAQEACNPPASAPRPAEPSGNLKCAALPAAPGAEYLAARARLAEADKDKIEREQMINGPGLSFLRGVSVEAMLRSIVAPLFWESDRIMRECVSRAASAWEAMELAEVLIIVDHLENHGGKADAEGRWHLPHVGILFGSDQGLYSTVELLLHVAFVVHWHAESIARHSLDAVERESVMEASAVAGVLVIAEGVMMAAGVIPEEGTVAQPTHWQHRACELRTRYYVAGGWNVPDGRDKFFNHESFAQRLGTASAKPTVAA